MLKIPHSLGINLHKFRGRVLDINFRKRYLDKLGVINRKLKKNKYLIINNLI